MPRKTLTLRCVVCGREFRAARKDVMTCSPECNAVRRNAVKREQRKTRTTGVCENCGREFSQRVAGQRFCSRACRLAARAKEVVSLSATVTRWASPRSEEALTRATTRPPWCSEQRWRIELARRKEPGRYAVAWEGLRHYEFHTGGDSK